VRLTDEVHLDITHHVRDDYRWARALRRPSPAFATSKSPALTR
jgi:hypothetical protein